MKNVGSNTPYERSKSVSWARSMTSRNRESYGSESRARASGCRAGGTPSPCGSLKTAGRMDRSKGSSVPAVLSQHDWQQTEQHEWHREGGDSDRLFDLTGVSIQSVVALEITKEAQAAGGINSAHALTGEAGAAGQQASASPVRSSPSILDSFEYRRKCGWERGFPPCVRILPGRERTTTAAVPVWRLPANPKLTETLLLFKFAMMHLRDRLAAVHEKHKPPPRTR